MSYVDKFATDGTDSFARNAARIGLGALVGILLVAFLAVGMVAVGAAEEDDDGPTEFLEDNLTKESDDDPLEIEVSFSDDFEDDTVETAEADLHFYDSEDYQNDSDTAEVLESDAIEGGEGESIANLFDISDYDSLDYGEDYTVVVEGDDDKIDDVERLDNGGLLGGSGGDGSPGFGVGVALIAIVAAALVAGKTRTE